MGQFVIAAYRPRPGKEQPLLELMKDHMPILRGQGLVTDRSSLVLQAADGTIVEIFEWKSTKAIEEAHRNPVVQSLWARFDAVCEYDSLANLEECKTPFASFQSVDL